VTTRRTPGRSYLLAQQVGGRGAGKQTPSSITVGRGDPTRIGNVQVVERSKARPCLRGSTSHRDYCAGCAGNLRCAACAADGGLPHLGGSSPRDWRRADARVPAAKHHRCSSPRVRGHVPDANPNSFISTRRVISSKSFVSESFVSRSSRPGVRVQEFALLASLGTAAFAEELQAHGPHLHQVCCTCSKPFSR
jgi:hypothetical protein